MTTEILGTVNPDAPEPPALWVPDDGAFGTRLAMIRQRMSWGNVKEAALACGLPPESWRTWERDNVEPRRYELICRQIAGRVGCDLDWLMRGSRGVEVSEHKIRFAPLAGRPIDNRPAGGPRKRDDRGETRRPVRIRNLPTGSDLRGVG